MTWTTRALVAGVGMIAATSASARAQYMTCDLSYCHVAQACGSADECLPFVSPLCEQFDTGVDGMGGATALCRPPCGTLFTCGAAGLESRCPVLGGVAGVCGGGVMSSTLFTAVCRFPAWGITYCVADGDVIPSSRFFACHHWMGAPVPNYLAGDCDADGCQNYRDPHPCSPDPAGTCPTDGGDLLCIEPGTTPPLPDGGLPDAGLPDAGLMDAGTGIDSGASLDAAAPVDTGAVDVDAGEVVRDAGGPNADASVTGPDASLKFEGGGGCSCRATGATGHAPLGASAALAALAALALVAARRRRR